MQIGLNLITAKTLSFNRGPIGIIPSTIYTFLGILKTVYLNHLKTVSNFSSLYTRRTSRAELETIIPHLIGDLNTDIKSAFRTPYLL